MSDSRAPLERFLLAQWQKRGVWYWLTLPLSMFLCLLAKLRRGVYLCGLKKSYRAPIPVVVVGNLTVGGSGKSPLVAYLTGELVKAGWRPVIISRGYKGSTGKEPLLIDGASKLGCDVGGSETVIDVSKAHEVGDEAAMLAEKTGVPVVVGADRVASLQKIVAQDLGDVVVSDDGFQHLRLARDVQLLVVDGARGYGNGACLPTGPLREAASVERVADAVIINGENQAAYQPQAASVFSMQMQPAALQPLFVEPDTEQAQALSAFAGKTVHALAGIGHPQRFFDMLQAAGLTVIAHAFSDHHVFQAEEVSFADELPVLVTEKDAVKLRSVLLETADKTISKHKFWVVPVALQVDNSLMDLVLNKLTTGGAHG